MAAVVERQQRVVESIRSGSYENVRNGDNLELIEGHGVFESASEISVNDRTLEADRIVLNTGTRPTEPPIEGIDEVETLDRTSALELREVPDQLAVLGVVRTLVLLMGLAIAYLSYKAYQRTGSRYLRNASIGFVIVAIGVFVEGLLFEIVGFGLVSVHIVESVIVAIGFGVLLYSLLQ